MLKLDNNRKILYQWDVGVVGTLTIDGVDEVHFSNLRYGVSFNIKVVDNKVDFPPEVLQSGADVFCWAFVRGENGGYTKKEQTFNVEKRPRPADYVYEPTEILSWEALKKEIEKLDEDTTEALADLEKGTLKIEDVITDTSTDPTNKYQVFSAEVMLGVMLDISYMIYGCEKTADKLTEYTENPTEANYYSAKAVNEMFDKIAGDLDEIGDIVGGEDSGTEVVIIPLGEYTIPEGSDDSMLEFRTTLPYSTITANTPYNFVFSDGDVNTQITFTDVEGAYVSGNLHVANPEYDDTGETYFILTEEYEGYLALCVFTKAIGTYTVGLSKVVE